MKKKSGTDGFTMNTKVIFALYYARLFWVYVILTRHTNAYYNI